MNIFYGICGEGLGHTIRSYRIIRKLLQDGHKVEIFTYGDAYKFFSLEQYPYLNEIQGFRYTPKNNRVDITKTVRNFYQTYKAINNGLETKLIPDLCITDFEPLIPRFANSNGIKCVSIDNQHKLLHNRLFPVGLKTYAILASCFIRWYIPVNDYIITTFHDVDNQSTRFIVRDELIGCKTLNDGHILIYVRKEYGDILLPLLNQINRKFIVYGIDSNKKYSNITFKPISNEEFIQDLLTCDRIISTAGNQLIGEAKYLQKPIMVLPIRLQTEQALNAWYVKKEKFGTTYNIKKLTVNKIEKFLCQEFKTYSIKDGANTIIQELYMKV